MNQSQDERKPEVSESSRGSRAAIKPRLPKPDRIRVELNVEKWPAIWRPASSKKAPTLRTLERQVELADGTRGTAQLEVGFTHMGTITTEDERMFYALIRHWEESGKPADRPVYFSDRLIARLLRKKGWGTNVITAITSSLRRLRTTPLRWINSYRRKETGGEYEEETLFTFLDTLKIITRKHDGHVTNQQGYFQFDREILANLLNNYTKPLLDEEFFKLRTEIGQLLYTHVDLMLGARDERGRPRSVYERRTRELFYDLGLLQDNPSYRYASNRKQALARPLAELRGKRISTGVLSSIELERSSDGKDYKVIFKKARAEAVLARAEDAVSEEQANQTAVVVNHYGLRKDQSVVEAEELVSMFYRVFHGVSKHYPQPRETAQALTLISQHGVQQAQFVVEFAKRAAQETGYAPQTFGGILQYTSRALADFDLEKRRSSAPQHAASITPSSQNMAPEAFARGEARIVALTPEQYQRLFDKTKAELRWQHAFLATKEGTAVHNAMIRSRMVRQLDQEPMAILTLDGVTDPEALRGKLGLQNLAL